MSTVIKSLFIGAIDANFDAEYIVNAFYCLDIATISRVTLIPFYRKSEKFQRAYIDVHEWHPTESAYNLIMRLKDTRREARIVHNDDNWWVVEVNKNLMITSNKKMEKFTTINFLAIHDTKEFVSLPWILSGLYASEENEWKKTQRTVSEGLLLLC